MKEQTANIYEANGEVVKIAYWHEFDNDTPIARCYKVTRSGKGGVRGWIFADNDTKKNKLEAYSLYWEIEEELEAM